MGYESYVSYVAGAKTHNACDLKLAAHDSGECVIFFERQRFRRKKLHLLQDFEERLDPADIVKTRSSAICFHAALCLLEPQCWEYIFATPLLNRACLYESQLAGPTVGKQFVTIFGLQVPSEIDAELMLCTCSQEPFAW